jgi:hypothetical protein
MLLLLFAAVMMGAGALRPPPTPYSTSSPSLYSVTLHPTAFHASVVPGAAAKAAWAPELNKTGWSTLDISTEQPHSDLDQYYAAGYIEGFLTADQIYAEYN